MINWVFFPKSQEAPELACSVVQVFERAAPKIAVSPRKSNSVLEILRPGLQALGFRVETGKHASERIAVPVLFGRNGRVAKSFDADAWHVTAKMIVEVEAGRGYLNNQFLKDLFQACMMHDVDYCGIAVRNLYIKSGDFEKVCAFFETLYASNRLHLPLKGVLLIGY